MRCDAPAAAPAGTLLSARHAAERYDSCWHGGLATVEALRCQMDALLKEYLASGDFRCGGRGPGWSLGVAVGPGQLERLSLLGCGAWRAWAGTSRRGGCCVTGRCVMFGPRPTAAPPACHLRSEAERCLQGLGVPHFHHDFVARWAASTGVKLAPAQRQQRGLAGATCGARVLRFALC